MPKINDEILQAIDRQLKYLHKKSSPEGEPLFSWLIAIYLV